MTVPRVQYNGSLAVNMVQYFQFLCDHDGKDGHRDNHGNHRFESKNKQPLGQPIMQVMSRESKGDCSPVSSYDIRFGCLDMDLRHAGIVLQFSTSPFRSTISVNTAKYPYQKVG
jgi:hypothetical protein